jgi:hypothetical protein
MLSVWKGTVATPLLTGDPGLDGFTVDRRLAVYTAGVDGSTFDGLWDTTTIGAFELTHTGQVSAKSNLQDYRFGPEVSFQARSRGTLAYPVWRIAIRSNPFELDSA